MKCPKCNKDITTVRNTWVKAEDDSEYNGSIVLICCLLCDTILGVTE